MRKPANLVYGVEETPPPLVVLITAVQHVGVIAIFMVYPLVIGREFGVTTDVLANILRMGMLALAIAVLLQALPHGPVGSRLLAPSSFTGVYLAPSLLAMKIGGLPLLWGMTIFAGLVEIALSRVWTRLRTFIPSETAGLVVFLIGVNVGLAALRTLIGDGGSGKLSAESASVAGVALAVMIGLNIWNKGQLRLFCILIGMMVGYVAAVAAGLLTLDDFMSVLRQPLFAFPSVAHVSFAFDPALIIPFAVSALAAAMGSTAVITTYQRTTDADWVRPDMISIRRGIFADGIAASTAGLLGTYGLTLATANVGLVVATGVASRRIALVVAAILGDRGVPARLRGGADHHAAAGDGVRAAVHGRVHHDQRRADHLDARARLPPHAGRRHGHDDVFRRFHFSGGVFRCAAVGAAGRRLAAGAGDAGGARAQSRVPARHPAQGDDVRRSGEAGL